MQAELSRFKGVRVLTPALAFKRRKMRVRGPSASKQRRTGGGQGQRRPGKEEDERDRAIQTLRAIQRYVGASQRLREYRSAAQVLEDGSRTLSLSFPSPSPTSKPPYPRNTLISVLFAQPRPLRGFEEIKLFIQTSLSPTVPKCLHHCPFRSP